MMKMFRKSIKPFISLLVILSMVISLPTPVLAQTMITETIDSVTMRGATGDEAEVEQSNIIGEDKSLRDEYTKHFITDAGTTIAAQYAVPVHYKDDNGEYVDYDNSLISSQVTAPESTTDEATLDETTIDEVSYFGLRTADVTPQTEEVLVNKKSNSKVSHYKKSGKANLIEIERDGHKISWGYSGANVVTAKEQENKTTENLSGNDAYLVLPNLSSAVLYENIYNNVDLEVINSTTGVKENIILKATNTKNVFKIEYNIGDLIAESEDAHTIVLKDSTGKKLYSITAPYMKDAIGETSKALELKILSNNKGKLSVKLTADKTWLKEKSRVYPVVVDPTVEYRGDSTEVSCTYIFAQEANTERTVEEFFFVGTNSDEANTEKRGLIKINNLPELGNGNMLVDAQAGLFMSPIGNLFATSYVGFYEMTEDWTESGKGTWNEVSGSYDNSLIDYNKISAGQENTWLTWNITELAKKWYQDPSSNNGIMIKMVDGTSVNQDIRFVSPSFAYDDEELQIARPTFLLTYRNNKGLENYWSYTAIDCGRAGTAYINDYSGNLVFDMPLASTASPVLSAGLSYVYNSYYAGQKYIDSYPYTGRGWKMNIQQTLYETTEDLLGEYQEDFPYVYTDADGTEHYFCPKVEDNKTKYFDEDGLGFELTIPKTSTTYYLITNKNNEKLHFNQLGLLYKMENQSGQFIKINYSGNKITSIVDAEGYSITFTVNDTTNNYVKTIKDSDSKITTVTFTGSKIGGITYNDGQSVSFTYDTDGKLLSVTDVDESKVFFTYSSYGSKGVTSVYEKGTGGTTGQKITFDRSKFNTTVIRSSGTDGSFNNGDDIVTTCQFDNFGMLTSTYSKTADGEYLSASDAEYTDRTVNDDASNIKQLNKVSQAYTIGANKDNLLVNHSMENVNSSNAPTNWNKASWGSSDVSFTISSQNNGLYGKNTMKMNVTSCVGNARGRVYQDVSSDYFEPGETYTLSGYAKTENITPASGVGKYGAVVCATFFNGSSAFGDYYSNYVIDDTDVNVDNGFRRISVTFKAPDSGEFTKIRINLALRSATGTVYFDAVQLEKASAAGHYNMLENSSFERLSSSTQPTDWIGLQLTDSTSYDCISNANVDGNHSYRITGSTSKWKNLYQNVYLNDDAKEEDTYILSGWATGDSIPIGSNNAKFRLLARVYYTDGEYRDKADISFNDTLENVNWQYASGAFNLNDEDDSEVRTPDYIKVYLVYNYQGNRGYFDNLMLIKEAVPSYTYDTEGNLTSVIANADQQSTYMYEDADAQLTPEDNLLTKYTNPNNKSYDYTYYDNKQIKSVTAPSGLKATYTYDSKGKANTVVLSNGDLSLNESLTYTYSNGNTPNYSVTATNQRGMVSTWRYDAKDGTLTGYTDPKGYTTNYYYNSNNDILTKIKNGDQLVQYTYDSDYKYLTEIKHGGTEYMFTYDQFGNTAKTEVGTHTLATNTYYGNNGNLKKVTYGNGHFAEYEYDSFGNLSTLSYNDTEVVQNYSNGRGDIIRSVDKINNLEYRAGFDSLGRLISKDVYSINSNGITDAFKRSVEYNYDIMNNVTKSTFAYSNGTNNTTNYFYDGYNRPLSSMVQSGKTLRNYYDGLNRVTKTRLNTTTPVETVYTYVNSGSNTTNIINTEISNSFAYQYIYDNNGNIISILNGEKLDDGTYRFIALTGNDYVYDRYNQLIKDTDYVTGDVTTYTYDINGNITQKEVANGRDSIITTYTYGNSSWGDLLTKYNGQTITYDAIGNPLTYRDGITMQWQNGRELKSLSKDGKTYNFTYDTSGLRTKKSITTASGSTATTTNVEYIYEGGQLMQMTYGDYVLDFSYDVNGTPIGFHAKTSGLDKYYYYGLNSRGDVEALYNADGTLHAKYEYDAYGKLISVKTSDGTNITAPYAIANLNPLRYRGYVYDSETGLYYLQSRYYDPVTCRFINADGYVSTGTGLNGFNMFAYCNNNPIQFIDSGGTRPIVGSSSSNETDDERRQSFEYMKQLTEYNLLISETKSSSKVHEFIKSYETFEPTVYDDGWGNPTVGYGHLVEEGEYYDTLSIFDAEILFLKDILEVESYVDEFSYQYGLSFNQHQYDALVSVSFNLPSSMVMILDDLSCGMDAYIAFTRDESEPGILARRTDEANIFMYNIYGRTY